MLENKSAKITKVPTEYLILLTFLSLKSIFKYGKYLYVLSNELKRRAIKAYKDSKKEIREMLEGEENGE